jgi:tetratricopeptide (TPR) repeat protein
MRSHLPLVVAAVFLPLSFISLVPAKAQMPNAGSPMASQVPLTGQAVAISGKVAVEGGADISRETAVVLQCGSEQRAKVNVDQRGKFSFFLYGTTNSSGNLWAGGAAVSSSSWADCNLHGEAAGYRSEWLNLAGEESRGVIQVGTILMHPLAASEGGGNFTVSVASLAAPDDAKKAFAKGEQQEKKGKWAAAADYFHKAVQAYPRYALAWLELGRVQMQQSNFMDAQQSFQEATTHDSNMLPAYVELARVQAQQQQWKALADTTGKLVELAPDSSPMFWLLDSAANYNLQNLARAESSATRGLRLDQGRRVPQLEYLYGLVLASRRDFRSAVGYLENYLKIAPKAHDAKDAQQHLTEFQHLLATETTAAAQP